MSDDRQHNPADRREDEILARARRAHLRAERYRAAGEIDAAIELCRTSLEITASAEAHIFLARVYAERNRYHEAVAQCHEAIKLDSEFGEAWNDVGTYLIELGRVEESILYFERAIRADRCDAPHEPHYNLGRVYERLGRWYEAVEEYDRAAALLPAHTGAIQARTSLLARLN